MAVMLSAQSTTARKLSAMAPTMALAIATLPGKSYVHGIFLVEDDVGNFLLTKSDFMTHSDVRRGHSAGEAVGDHMGGLFVSRIELPQRF